MMRHEEIVGSRHPQVLRRSITNQIYLHRELTLRLQTFSARPQQLTTFYCV